MTSIFRSLIRFAWASALILLFVAPIFAQDSTEEAPADNAVEVLPVIPYFTSTEGGIQFNMPIPDGWQVSESDSEADFVRMTSAQTDGEIFVESFPSADVIPIAPSVNEATATLPEDQQKEAEKARSAQGAALMGYARLVPDEALILRVTDVVTMDGFRWDVFAFDIEGGGTVSAFVQMRDAVYYTIYYRNPNAAQPFFIFVAQAGNINDTVPLEDGLRLLYSDFAGEQVSAETVAYGSSTWTRTIFETPEGTLYTLHRTGLDKLYLMVEEGDPTTLDFVNRALFTLIFGFFITPQNDGYLWLAVGVALTILVGFTISLWLRFNNVKKDLKFIEELRESA